MENLTQRRGGAEAQRGLMVVDWLGRVVPRLGRNAGGMFALTIRVRCR